MKLAHLLARIGSRKSIPVDVRLVAATNVDLNQAVNAGRFRRDLLYRLNIAQVHLPALRERPGDMLPLLSHFVRVYAARMNLRQPEFTPEAKAVLLGYAWPGNIRELENVVHFALLVAGDRAIDVEHLRVSFVSLIFRLKNVCINFTGITPHITGGKKQSEERAALFTV